MKGKIGKRWGILCVSAVAIAISIGIGWDVPKAQAVDMDHIYGITTEDHFTFDAETGLITGYQDVPDTIEGDSNLSHENDNGSTETRESDSAETDIEPSVVVVIPQEIQGVAVKGLDKTFLDNTVVQKVIIPDTIEVFGDDSFNGCTSLYSISVYQTGESFSEEQVTEQQSQDWQISFVHTGDVYYSICDQGWCAVIPASLQEIGARVFNSCALNSFDVMEGSVSFADSNEGGINLAEGVGACLMSYDGTKLYRIAPGYRDQENSTQYTIPEGITEILPYAGQKLGLQYIEVANTVQTIDGYAFYQSGLLGITFTEVSQVEEIGEWAFAYNDNLDIILPPSVKSIGTYCFAYIANRTPDLSQTQITVIPEYAFAGCPNLHTITMPATLQIIENYAFAGNANLNEVVFTGETLSSIGTGAFQNCTNMHRIDIPAGVTSIEADTFAGCSNLNEVVLPEGLTEIKDEAFADCQNIHSMVIPSTVTYIANNSFSGSNTGDIDTSKNTYAQQMIKGSTAATTVSSTKTAVPKPAVPKKGYQIKVGNLYYKVTKSDAKAGTVTVVKASSKSVKKVVIPSGIKISGYTFQVTAISAKAFLKNKKLTNVTIGANVKSIGKQAFKNCKKLKKITIKSAKLKKGSVGAGAFQGIVKKATIKVPKKKLKAYKKFLPKKGVGKKAKIKKS